MANQKEIFDLVESYLSGELSANKLANFEAELSTNLAIQKQLKLAKAAQKLVIQNRLLQVKALSREELSRSEVKKNTTQKFLIGGSIGLIAALSGLFFITKTNEPVKTELPISEEIKVKKPIDSVTKTTNEEATTSLLPIATDTTSQKKTQPKTIEIKEESTPQHTLLKGDKVLVVEKPTTIQNQIETAAIEKTESSKNITPICNTENIKAHIHTTNGCEGKNESSIEVGVINGLLAPIKKQLFDSSNQPLYSNYDLKDGSYTLLVSGADSCYKHFPIIIKSKKCAINVDFNPSFGEVWEIPTSNVAGVLTIRTKTGLEILHKKLLANEATTWAGKNEQNEIQTGYYIFTIYYEDGSFLKGGITVTQ